MFNYDKSQNFSIYYLSEEAITIEFGTEISETILLNINKFNSLLNLYPFPGFRTTVTAYTTLTVFYNSLEVFKASEMQGRNGFQKVRSYLLDLIKKQSEIKEDKPASITIPVCYGGKFGPDLVEVAKIHNLAPDEVIQLHSSSVYKVYMIGFVPGFAYLGGMTDGLETPRKSTPRKSVPAGSVGIAGRQTGVYPLETPGGWQLIGQTPLKMFDAEREIPSILKSGDNVIFKPISPKEFSTYKNPA